jgi:hypothetical protein
VAPRTSTSATEAYLRIALVTALLLTGCLDDSESAKDQTSTVYMGDVATLDLESVELASDLDAHDAERDVCDLATELASDDVCSLICDPDQFVARLLDSGTIGGRCYQWRCELAYGVTVNVGVCIP